ncbi:sigma-54-dependent Fis family transcriptional regulator [Pseudomonas matsuisoli]|uniref:Sigma-54-dependent Fis family transcriptional regulator n=1 Tax=Pseudomonas matsuisoli TaxID=1515666 RepID=A0A917PRW2_9PSED|nr:sigma-54-dependent Fis family transcriptional regulator [Pseudomonas matsuisoli]
MNSPDVHLLPTALPQPLRYAEALLRHFTALSHVSDTQRLVDSLVEAAIDLTSCESGQLYLLDETATTLKPCANWYQGQVQPLATDAMPSDYDGSQLLQYCLCQNRVLAIEELDVSLHDTTFLPPGRRWRSLLCLPISGADNHVVGLMVMAGYDARDLNVYAKSLAGLASAALERMRLLQRLRTPVAVEMPISAPVIAEDGYGFIGRSAPMKALYRLIAKVLHTPVNVLLNGETGTGKELAARAIHDFGSRRAQTFVVQNCASLPESLLESELFGYVKGAFTGADRDRKGLFDVADGGTLFLDEIGDMPMTLQAKLLRVLQEGEVRPVGSATTHKVDVRIIAATHHDLRKRVEQGLFREDLYYRLTHFPIVLPALRERGEDILVLARHFADKACAFLQRRPCRWSDAALDCLASYQFPGNVRELKGLVERAVLLCEGGELLPAHFALQPEHLSAPPTGNIRERLDQVERNLLLDCLRKNAGNQSQAARELGLPRRTFLYRMKVLGITAKHV